MLGVQMKKRTVWLKACYHMAAPYSIRMPPSSPFAGRALPTPGPATVQLAMIRTGIELYGLEVTRRQLFRNIVASQPLIQPPLRVGIGDRLSSVLKANSSGGLESSVGYRQVCHANGPICVFIRVPPRHSYKYKEILMGIGYWEQGNGFASCTQVQETEPVGGTYAVAFESVTSAQKIRSNFSGYVTELEETNVMWSAVVSDDLAEQSQALRHRLYVWPLVSCEHQGAGKLWQFCSLVQG